ncbi:uncharacterized protein N7506_011151 [Penicillium brevicompactum]|uniref:uncharacterized protein n=1 Tax=Penicillium brevicompactum TaxID=5074 RepID=UPI00253FD938|nr:uncharacterized protein N7506_011151 [Penicillium brevicompactum]KAJ5322021.1 hypothetical protein N7506_011151 [Penicillium brevicompactum]
MTFHLSSLFSSSESKSNPQACASFSLRSAPWDGGKKILVHPSGYPMEAPPMYTIAIPSANSSSVVLSHGWGGGQWDIVGDARLPTFSSKVRLTTHGQGMEMRFSEMSGSATIQTPNMGKLKWKLDSMALTTLELRDESGTKLAKYYSGKTSGEKVLEILVPHDVRFLELVLLSGFATKTLNKTALETSGEVFGAIVGA